MKGHVLPIRQWRLRNFKSIAEAQVDFAPLTLIVGANSSGKSSLIQSIVLASQAAQGFPRETFPLNGSLMSLGGFDNVLSAFSPGGNVEIGATFGVSDLPHHPYLEYVTPRRRRGRARADLDAADDIVRWTMTLSGQAAQEASASDIARLTFEYPREHVEIACERVEAPGSAQDPDERIGDLDAWAFPYHYPDARPSIASRNYHGTLDVGGHSRELFGVMLGAGLPTGVLVQERRSQWLARRAFDFLDFDEEGPTRVRRAHADEVTDTELRKLAADIAEACIQLAARDAREHEHVEHPFASAAMRRAARILSGVPNAQRAAFMRLLPETILSKQKGKDDFVVVRDVESQAALGLVTWEIANLLSTHVRYMGPLRQDPQVVYKSLSPADPTFAGSKGEHVPYIVHTYGKRLVNCPLGDGGSDERSLRDALKYWITKLGIGTGVVTEDVPRYGLELRLEQEHVGRAIDLTGVGVGISQLIPVLVMCLLSRPGSVLLLEQPELHLHPALQQRLGDFLLAMAQSGRQLIVETHSEYLMTRLRRRIASDEKDQALDDVRFVFAERAGGRTGFRQVVANRFGGFDNWPDGFFDESSEEARAIMRLSLEKKERHGL